MLIMRKPELRKRIFKTSAPAMLEMALYMLIGVVDVAVVGHLGAVPLAAVGLGAQVFFSIIISAEALGIGASILVAQAKGAGKMEHAQQVTAQTLTLALLIGIPLAFLGVVYAGSILELFPVTKDVHTQALSYLQITFKVAPVAIALYLINSVFRGLARTDIPMKIAVIQNIINCVGDYVLVYGVSFFPALGVAGAAWATVIAHTAAFIIALWALIGGWTELKIKLKEMLFFQFDIIKKIVRLGLPSFAEEAFFSAAGWISYILVTLLGTLSLASHQVTLTVESLSFMPGFGVSIAATTLVGQAVGAKNKQLALDTARGCAEVALLFMGFLGLLFALVPHPIAAVFTSDPEIIVLTGILIRIASLEQVTIALSMVLGGILKGSGDTRTPMFINAFFTWFFRLPLMCLFIRVFSLPISYTWALFVVDWLLRTAAFLFAIKKQKWLKDAS
ncbi:MAG: MATE family efflux transporter [Syntrophomonadaceae bacterium]|nr:MATE family efflux transporter [Syntrophomonadaceae bacterium]